MKLIASLTVSSIILFLGCSSPTVIEPAKVPSDHFHDQSERISVSGISYRIDECCWSTRLKTVTNLNSDDGHKLLVVRLFLTNEAKLPLTNLGVDMMAQDVNSYIFEPDKFVFYLIDEKGTVYFPEKNLANTESLALRLISPLNPGVDASGIIAFDVADDHQYSLRLPSTAKARRTDGKHFFRLSPAPYSRKVAAEMDAKAGK